MLTQFYNLPGGNDNNTTVINFDMEYDNDITIAAPEEIIPGNGQPFGLVISSSIQQNMVDREICVKGLQTPEFSNWNNEQLPSNIKISTTSPWSFKCTATKKKRQFNGRTLAYSKSPILSSQEPSMDMEDTMQVNTLVQLDQDETIKNSFSPENPTIIYNEQPETPQSFLVQPLDPKFQNNFDMYHMANGFFGENENIETIVQPFEDVNNDETLAHDTSMINENESKEIAEQVRFEALNETMVRQQEVYRNCDRLGVMCRFPNDTDSPSKYRYKFRDGQEYRESEARLKYLTNQVENIKHQLYNLKESRSTQWDQSFMIQKQNLDHIFNNIVKELNMQTEKLQQLRKDRTFHIKKAYTLLLEDESPFKSRPLLQERYVLFQLLGRGGFCEVWKVFDLVRRKYFAAKIHSNYNHACSEYNVQKNLNHPNIVGIHDELIVGKDAFDGYFVIIMELVEHDLSTLLKINGGKLSEENAKNIIEQIMAGLLYMNSNTDEFQRLVHLDLKPENVLLTPNGCVKLADFGLSKLSQPLTKPNQLAGTYYYLPPECFSNAPFEVSSKIDVWSIGVLFYQLLFGSRPFGEGMTQKELVTKRIILNATNVEFPGNCNITPESFHFIERCLQYNQSERPSVRNLCGM